MEIVVSTDIEVAPDDVWRYVRLIDRHVEWMHDAVRIDFRGEQRSGVGTVFDTVTRVGPLSTTDRMTITEWVDGEAIGVRHEGAVVGQGRFTIAALPGGRSRFEWAETLRLPWFLGGRPGGLVAKPVLEALWRRNLEGLRARLLPAADRTPGALVASGRDTEVREYGPGLVIRAARDGRSLDGERTIMRHAAEHGYPVPVVHDHDDPSVIVMDRVEGRTMLADLVRRPWRLRRHARTLAGLHIRLARIDAPPALRGFGSGGALLHLDLHPGNVLLGPDGPVVIDWTNAARGDPGLDVATTWLLMQVADAGEASAAARPVIEAFRYRFAAELVRRAGRPSAEQVLQAAERRLLDARMVDGERDRLFALARAARDGTVPRL